MLYMLNIIKHNSFEMKTPVINVEISSLMKRIYLSIVFAIFLSVATTGQAETQSTLQEAIEKTVASNPEVQARYHTFKSAEQEQNAARGGLLPKADINTTFRRQESVGQNIGNTAIPERQTQLVIRQMLFDGFATSGEVKRLGHAARVRYYELLSVMQNSALEVVRAYFDIERYRQLVVYAQDNYIAHKQLFDRIEERVKAGVARRVDLEQASGRLALAEANLLTETTNLHDVTARYQRLVGELPPDSFAPVDFYKAGVQPTVNDALQVAYKQSPDLLSTIENIVATQQEVENKKAKYMPRLDLQAKKNLSTSSDGANSISAADVLELTLSFNLFNGLTDRSVISQTVEKLNTSQDLRDKACVDTRQTLVIAYNDIVRLKEQLAYRDQHQLSIEKAREAYRKQFDIGQRTLLDLLDTENEYFQARRVYTVTEYDLYTAYARTYASQGELLSRLGIVRTDLPEFARPDYFDSQNICAVAAPTLLKVDKVDIVAKAKPISDSLVSLSNKISPPPAASTTTTAKPTESEVISGRLATWVDAWQAKNYEEYINHYALSFVPEKGMQRSVWAQQRKQRLNKPGDIKISLKNINIVINGDKANADFVQVYQSGTLNDTMNKQLQFERINSKWMIVKEISK